MSAFGRCCTTGKQGGCVCVRFWVDVALWVNRKVRQYPLLCLCCPVGKQGGASVSAFGSVSNCPAGKQGGSVSVRFWVGVALWVNREVHQCLLLGRCCHVGKQGGASGSAFGSVSS